MTRLRLALLGGFHARLAPGRALSLGKKAQALVAYLALRPGQPHSREKVATLLWGELGEEQARHSVRQTLFTLRRALSGTTHQALLIEGETLALNLLAADVDVVTFEHLVANGSPEAIQQASTLYQGDLLEGLNVAEPPFEQWLLAERERLRELARSALAKLLSHQRDDPDSDGAIHTAVRLLALDPLEESVHRTLMRLYVRAGRRGAALRQYRICADLLQRELSVEPEPETRQLYEEVRPVALQSTVPSRPRPDRRPRRGSPYPQKEAAPSDTPLIGRTAELDRLARLVDDAWRGRTCVVAILGEAGVGKTRLVEALAVEAGARGGHALLGRCYKAEQLFPFRPWVDAFRTAGIILDRDRLRGLRPVWRTELARLFPELDEAGIALHPAAEDQLRLLESVAQLIEHLACREPLVLVLEDVHWADEMSLRLLSYLAHRLRSSPVLVAVTVREEELAETPMLPELLAQLDRETGLVRLVVPPLTRQDTVALVRALVRPDALAVAMDDLGDRVWVASEGNPLMVVETMRALDAGKASDAPDALPFPQRVQELILARIARLSRAGRDLLATAALIGRQCELALLQRAPGLQEIETATALEEVVDRRLLTCVGDHVDFAHDRIREVVCRRLLPPRVTLLHRRVAVALEEIYAHDLERHVARLGAHYLAGEVWDKAACYLRRAGAQAMAVAAYRQAAALFDRALTALEHVPADRTVMDEQIELHVSLRYAFSPLGDLARMGDETRKAAALATALGDRRQRARTAIYQTHYLWLTGALDQALESGTLACSLAKNAENPTLTAIATLLLGVVHSSRGDYDRAADLLSTPVPSADDLAREGHASPTALSVLYGGILVRCLAFLGRFDEAVARGREVLRLAETSDRPLNLVHACSALGSVHLLKGEFDDAVVALERGLQLCRVENFRIPFPALASALGTVYVSSGRIVEGLALLQEAVGPDTTLAHHFVPAGLTNLGWGYLLAGRPDEATSVAARALALARERHDRGAEGYTLRLLGEIITASHPVDVTAAREWFQQALEIAQERCMRPLVALCYLGLGRLHGRVGDSAIARDHLARARRMFLDLDMRFYAEQSADPQRPGDQGSSLEPRGGLAPRG